MAEANGERLNIQHLAKCCHQLPALQLSFALIAMGGTKLISPYYLAFHVATSVATLTFLDGYSLIS